MEVKKIIRLSPNITFNLESTVDSSNLKFECIGFSNLDKYRFHVTNDKGTNKTLDRGISELNYNAKRIKDLKVKYWCIKIPPKILPADLHSFRNFLSSSKVLSESIISTISVNDYVCFSRKEERIIVLSHPNNLHYDVIYDWGDIAEILEYHKCKQPINMNSNALDFDDAQEGDCIIDNTDSFLFYLITKKSPRKISCIGVSYHYDEHSRNKNIHIYPLRKGMSFLNEKGEHCIFLKRIGQKIEFESKNKPGIVIKINLERFLTDLHCNTYSILNLNNNSKIKSDGKTKQKNLNSKNLNSSKESDLDSKNKIKKPGERRRNAIELQINKRKARIEGFKERNRKNASRQKS